MLYVQKKKKKDVLRKGFFFPISALLNKEALDYFHLLFWSWKNNSPMDSGRELQE